jgi:preprotein translocase subunit SecA
VDREIDVIADKYLSRFVPMDSWEMAGFVAAVEGMGLGGPEITEDALWDFHSRDAIALHIKDLAAEKLEEKDQENSEDWALLERLVLLRTIDSVWVEHLTEIDEMRAGIGLRGYAQEEPLNAFKKEAFALYEEMGTLIRHQVATTIFRVSIVRTPTVPVGEENIGDGNGDADGDEPAPAKPAGGAPKAAPPAALPKGLPKPIPQGRPSGGSSTASGGNSAGGVRPGFSPAGVRMGRNDACWCDSGKKYKKCHGQ